MKKILIYIKSLCLAVIVNITFSGIIFSQTPRTDVYSIFSVPKSENTWPALDSLGVGWIRLQNQMGEANRQAAIQFYNRALSEGYGLWITLHHRDRSNVQDTELFDNSTRGSFPPVDQDIYKNLVVSNIQPLVDSLIADGKDPAKWLVIQFSNEVMPSDVLPDSPSRFFHGTSDEYLATLSLTYEAVKSIDNNIPVAFGAISSLSLEAILEYENNPNDSLKKIEEWTKKLLSQGEFDWADIHLYHSISSIPQKVAWIKSLWTGPLAATEDGGPDARTGTDYSEMVQADRLPSRINTTVESGVDRVFWSFLQDIDIPGDPLAQTLGLITLDWRKKDAYWEYQKLISNSVTGINGQGKLPSNYELSQNYPNPFNPTTVIEYSLPVNSSAAIAVSTKLIVYDVLGREIQTLINKYQPAGNYKINFDASELNSGVYFYQLRSGKNVITKKMLLLK